MLKRREFLQCTAAAVAALMAPQALALGNAKKGGISQQERKIRFYNLHTGERLAATYFAEGQYQAAELVAINKLLRDHRNGEVVAIDQRLLDQLYLLQYALAEHRPFEVISAYRSPATNQRLLKTTTGVAKKSLHMQGRAIDVRLTGVELSRLRKAAMTLKAGGVGYYPTSNFVHLDTGRYRFW